MSAAASAAFAAVSAAEAQRAHEERCRAELATYQPQGATVQQMQSYAGCVRTLYPNEMSQEGVLMLKGLFLLVLLGGCIGAVRVSRGYGNSWPDVVVMGFGGGMLATLMGTLAIAGILTGLCWVFS